MATMKLHVLRLAGCATTLASAAFSTACVEADSSHVVLPPAPQVGPAPGAPGLTTGCEGDAPPADRLAEHALHRNVY
jgi:hypothetical protein